MSTPAPLPAGHLHPHLRALTLTAPLPLGIEWAPGQPVSGHLTGVRLWGEGPAGRISDAALFATLAGSEYEVRVQGPTLALYSAQGTPVAQRPLTTLDRDQLRDAYAQALLVAVGMRAPEPITLGAATAAAVAPVATPAAMTDTVPLPGGRLHGAVRALELADAIDCHIHWQPGQNLTGQVQGIRLPATPMTPAGVIVAAGGQSYEISSQGDSLVLAHMDGTPVDQRPLGPDDARSLVEASTDAALVGMGMPRPAQLTLDVGAPASPAPAPARW